MENNFPLGSLAAFRAGIPGIYEDIPLAEYFAIDAIHSSTLKEAHKSAAHLKQYEDEEFEMSEALIIGSALHCAVLEQDRFAKEYVVAPKCDLRTTNGKNTMSEFIADNDGKTIIKAEQMYEVERMRDSILAHPAASEIINLPGQNELTMLRRDEATGLLYVIRIDKYMLFRDKLTIVDIKTTKNGSPSGFPREAANYGYDIQGGFYSDVASAVEEQNIEQVLFITIEKKSFITTVYNLEELDLRIGKQKYKSALELLIECRKTGKYPGYSDSILPLSLPVWATEPLIEEEEEEYV
jgi:hypothetical protein